MPFQKDCSAIPYGSPEQSKISPSSRMATVDPTAIETLDDWLLFYKAGSKNLKLDKQGNYLVLDGERIVKMIPHLPKESDYVTILLSSTNTDLRGAAEAKRDAVRTTRQTLIDAAQKEYLEKEQELLGASDTWETTKRGNDAAARHAAALIVGTLTVELRQKETALQEARYPVRYAPRLNRDLPRKVIDIDTHDDRVISVAQLIVQEVATSDRGVAAPVPAIANGTGTA